MGLGRFIKHTLEPATFAIDLVKNMLDTNSVVEGFKKSIKQEFTEDNPLTSSVYKYGKYYGKKEGYAEASAEYEKKLLEQADEFLKQKKDYKEESDEYEALLDAYERKIEELKNKVDKTQAEKNLLQQFLSKEHELRNL